MTFTQEAVKTPTSIGPIRIKLTNLPDGTNTTFFTVEVLDQNGILFSEERGDLTPHLSAGQITTINNFLAAMRTKAVDEIL